MRSANSSAGNDATARREHELVGNELFLRVASAIVLAPLAVLLVYAGPPYLSAGTVVIAGAMAWEWARLCRGGAFDSIGWLVLAAVVSAVVLATSGAFAWGLATAGLGSVAVVAAARGDRGWVGAAPAAIAVPCIAILWLRNSAGTDEFALFWLLGVVWGTDTGAYVAGRSLGGPKLAPKISPKKTWSGLLGGMACAVAWGVGFGAYWGAGQLLLLGILAACLALAAQGGDLTISVLKRRYGAKDASRLIPGHGGVLDRLDGLLPTAPALAAVILITTGGQGGWP